MDISLMAPQNISLAWGGSVFGSSIHAHHELIQLGPEARKTKHLVHLLKLLGHENLDRFVLEVTIKRACLFDSIFGPHTP